MTNDADQGYFRQRAAQEREIAARSEDTAARRVHSDLAERYDDLVRDGNAMPLPLQIS